MEEVDSIIFHTLRQIGCEVDEGVKNLSSFNIELVIEATVKCLEIIRPGLGISPTVPVNMAARFRLGADLAQTCVELGYRGDIGYQTFLYSSEADLRRVFMFLIEKLPKESDKGISETTDKLDQLEKSVSAILSKQLSVPWVPHYCHNEPNGTQTQIPYSSKKLCVPSLTERKEFEEYYKNHELSKLNRMDGYKFLLPSIIRHNAEITWGKSANVSDSLEWLSHQPQNKVSHSDESIDSFKGLKLMSRFSLNGRLHERLKNEEEYHHNRDGVDEKTSKDMIIAPKASRVMTEKDIHNFGIEDLKKDCDELRSVINSYESETKELTLQLSLCTVRHQEEECELKVLEERNTMNARTYDLLDNSDENMRKLELAIEAEKNKLINLATQWERHRTPLIKRYRDEREKHSAKANTSQKKLDELRQMRDRENQLTVECQLKDQHYSQLLIDVQKQPKEINRSAYTQRILEIINNVRKQKDEIDKVLNDTRNIQKEINLLSGKLERSFTVVDELIFRDAKTNEASRRTYKLLATLHADCGELVTLVEETGTALREIRDLEEQIDSESSKNIEANLQRITADLDQMRQETASLMAQISAKAS